MLPRPFFNVFIALLLFALALALSVPVQTASVQSQKNSEQKDQKKQNDSLIRLETELVQIDVVVHDSKGHLVRELKREDFEVLEDGKPQQISHFAVGTAARPAVWL